MTGQRPRVDPDKRQRTAQACDSCKKRKQKYLERKMTSPLPLRCITLQGTYSYTRHIFTSKANARGRQCDGQMPCATCQKRTFECTYHTSDPEIIYRTSSGEQSSPKRVRHNTGASGSSLHDESVYQSSSTYDIGALSSTSSFGRDAASSSGTLLRAPPRTQLQEPPALEPESSASQGGDEEADNHTMARMLEDETGRLLYIGDASTLSFLQLLRMIVETAVGPCSFSLDPQRHGIVENRPDLSLERKLTYQLPEKETALILVQSFFTNTYGVLEMFDEKTFLSDVERCYSHPRSIDRPWLCLLFLVLAIGLSFATPFPGTREATVVGELRNDEDDQAEVFYCTARKLNDPMVGLEDSNFWSVQALTLMAMYMLLRSMRDRAFAYLGMAIRSGYSLGIHSEEALVYFSPEMQTARRMLWRSLFILDRFLAASLGRPLAITEDEALGDILGAFAPGPASVSGKSAKSGSKSNPTCSSATAAAVRSCHVVGIILRKVYRQRRISTRLAQKLADECIRWPQLLAPELHWRKASPNNVRQSIAILHTNLLYCHSIILLTRPFFLYLLSDEVQRTRLSAASSSSQTGRSRKFGRKSGKFKKFSKACVVASNHTVALVHNAYDGGYLPQRNTMSTYALFAAALVVFANEFAWPSDDALSAQCMANSITILEYSGLMDPMAKRCAIVLRHFREVLSTQKADGSISNSLSQPTFDIQSSSFVQLDPQNSIPSSPGDTLPPLPGATIPPNPSTSAFVNPDTTSNFAPQLTGFDGFGDSSFSGLLDLENTVLPVTGQDGREDHSSSEDPVDFNTLWLWPTGGTPLPRPS